MSNTTRPILTATKLVYSAIRLLESDTLKLDDIQMFPDTDILILVGNIS